MNDHQFQILFATLNEQNHLLDRVREEIEDFKEIIKGVLKTEPAPKTEVES